MTSPKEDQQPMTTREELVGNLPLQYFDGPDYCTVKDATGGDFALTVQPDLMKLMEDALASRQEVSVEELVALRDWIRRPDYAEEFSLADVVDWINQRPVTEVERLASRQEVSVTVEELASIYGQTLATDLLAKYSITRRTTEG